MKNFVTFRRAITPVHSAKMTPKKEVITPKMTKKMIMGRNVLISIITKRTFCRVINPTVRGSGGVGLISPQNVLFCDYRHWYISALSYFSYEICHMRSDVYIGYKRTIAA
jgi:hypothetical protein